MKILNIQVLRGPNFWSVNHKLIQFTLDIGKYEQLPTDELPGFYERIRELLPGMYHHHCSEGKPGGFFERIKRGTWLGHVTEHIALELQTLAGMPCNYGKTRGTSKPGVYDVAFTYLEERAGIYAGEAAVRIAESLAEGLPFDLENDIYNLRKISEQDGPGPSTSAILKAAEKRNIPYIRIGEGSFYQLGYGCEQRMIEATIAGTTSAIAVDIAVDKNRTKILLEAASLPVPAGITIRDEDEIAIAVTDIGYPMVIKPNDGNQGKGVTVNIRNDEELLAAFRKAKVFSEKIIAEKFYAGHDYRILVINYELVAASLRTPALVTGDGISTVSELIREVNKNPLRGDEHENILTKIRIDDSTIEMLRQQDLGLDSIAPGGTRVILKHTANLSTGGTAEDVTHLVHPEITAVLQRAARVIGLDICGIDFICNDISKPLDKECAILEVNAAPGFRMHTHPSLGKPRPVGEAVVNMLFPGQSTGRIPIIAVTGTNGKTTTTRIIAHIARTAGFVTGYTTTEGIYIGNDLVEEGDCTGPVSAEKVLRDRSVEVAVLECARGGMLRSGLAFDRCDVGVVTNVAEDHIGLKNINSLEDMIRVKSIVPESVRKNGYAVLNENDPSVFGMRKNLKCKVALYSINGDSSAIKEHCNQGGIAAIFKGQNLILMNGLRVVFSENIMKVPVAFGGKAPFMIDNLLASITAAYCNNIGVETIRSALRSFLPSFENNPGRMNVIELNNITFIIDYAHNFHGISAIGEFIRQYPAKRKIGIVTTAGDRRDIDIYNVGRASAKIFERIIVKVDKDTRGRPPEEIIDLILTGIMAVERNLPVSIIRNELDAIRYALHNALPGSLVVLFAEKVRDAFRLVHEYKLIEERQLMQVTT